MRPAREAANLKLRLFPCQALDDLIKAFFGGAILKYLNPAFPDFGFVFYFSGKLIRRKHLAPDEPS